MRKWLLRVSFRIWPKSPSVVQKQPCTFLKDICPVMRKAAFLSESSNPRRVISLPGVLHCKSQRGLPRKFSIEKVMPFIIEDCLRANWVKWNSICACIASCKRAGALLSNTNRTEWVSWSSDISSLGHLIPSCGQ